MGLMTKGKMVSELKKAGVRKGDKNGAEVGLEHLKSYQVIALYYEHIKEKHN